MRYVLWPIALCAVCSFLLPVAAYGQAGAQLNPDSPAGVEYQLPLEQARTNAGGGGDGPGSGGDRAGRGGVASLFGAGIVPVKRSGGEEDGGDAGGARGGLAAEGGASGSGSGAGDGEDASSGAKTIERSALGTTDDDEGSAALRIAGIALAVLLAGGLLGVALRRGLRQSEE